VRDEKEGKACEERRGIWRREKSRKRREEK